jgi:hypothetical protein
MFFFAGALAMIELRSEKPRPVDLRSSLTSTMTDPAFWIATVAWAALAYQLAK